MSVFLDTAIKPLLILQIEIGIDQQECPAGEYGNGGETDWGCRPCPASEGLYQDSLGAKSCKKVEAGFYVKEPESKG